MFEERIIVWISNNAFQIEKAKKSINPDQQIVKKNQVP